MRARDRQVARVLSVTRQRMHYALDAAAELRLMSWERLGRLALP